jgi:hypothetical protein
MLKARFAMAARHLSHHSDQNRSGVEPFSREYLARDGETLLTQIPQSAALETEPGALIRTDADR